MSDSGDVDKMLSEFLSELNALSDAIGPQKDKPTPESEPEKVAVAHPPAARETAAAEQEAKPVQTPPDKPLHYRNIDILLMDDAKSAAGSGAIAQHEIRDQIRSQAKLNRLRRAVRRWVICAAVSVALLYAAVAFFRLDPFGLISSRNVGTGLASPERGSVSPAVPMDSIVARYPSRARKLGITGTVDVRVDIDETGRVVRAVPINGPAPLRSAAAEAVKKCRFRPARQDGVNIKSTAELSVPFKR